VRREALAAVHRVVVQHAQGPEAHVPPVVVVGEREGVVGVEPAVVGVAAVSALRMVIMPGGV
jgi:ribosomal protein S5